MSKNKTEKRFLNYFNLALSILMLVVLSLNIEQILHNRRIFKSDNFKILKPSKQSTESVETIGESEYMVLSNCRQCQKEALKMLTKLNGIGPCHQIKTNKYYSYHRYKHDLNLINSSRRHSINTFSILQFFVRFQF